MTHSTDGPDDLTIVDRVLDGDVNAFEILLNRYHRLVSTILKRRLPLNEVEGIAQEVFIRAYQSLPGFQRKGEFKSWLSAIAVRTCYDFWRKRYRNREMPTSSLSEAQRDWLDKVLADNAGRSFAESGRRAEAAEILNQALNQLSAADRMVLELVYLEERSVKEAAELLGWTVANVKVRSFRSRNKLRKLLTTPAPGRT